MSFGASTTSRFELETTQKGKPGIFFVQKESKPKVPRKYGYKERNLRHPIRNTNQAIPVEENVVKKPVKPEKNFIKKNRERLAGHGSDKGQTITNGTVTLTQEQLTAILESVGNLKDGKENALRISIDPKSNNVKITSPKKDEDSKLEALNSNRSKSSEGDILALLNKNNDPKDESKSENVDVENFQAEISARKEKSTIGRSPSPEKTKETSILSPVKELNLPPVPPTHLTVAEKKRLQWALERAANNEEYNPWGKPGAGAGAGAGAPPKHPLDDHLETKNHNKEEINDKINTTNKKDDVIENKSNNSKYSNSSFKLSPNKEPVGATLNIGQLTADEEKQAKKEENQRKLREDLEKQLAEKKERDRKEKEKDNIESTWSNQFSIDHKPAPLPPQLATFVSSSNKNTPRVNKESLDLSQLSNWNKDQKIPPAAMRSSFAFGGLSLDDSRYKETKEEEKRKWLEELEKQKEEKRLSSMKEKEKLKALEVKEAEQWAEKASPRIQNTKKDPAESYHHYDDNILDTGNNKTIVDSARSNSAPDPQAQPLTLIRGQNVVIDPVTLKDLEMKRKKHLEHQEAIKSQIEEKKNNVRLERERKWAEEQEMEKKLQRERDVIQKQYELEQQKIREKEQVREQQLHQLKQAMDEAQERALHEKHLRRMQHLQEGGHDISNLKANYEAMTPRVQQTSMSFSQLSGVPQLNLSTRDQNILRLSHGSDGNVQEVDPQLIHHDDYVNDRVLTPFKNLSEPFTDPYSTKRHFGTQTLTNEKDLNREVSDVKIEYKMDNPKGENVQREKKGTAQTNVKKVRLKSAAEVKKMREARARSKEKLGWNYNNPKKKKAVKNSEKDPFYEKKKRESEERHAKRAAQLYKMIEANKPVIPTEHPPGSRDPSPRRHQSLSPIRGSKHTSPRLDRSLSPTLRTETRLIHHANTSPRRAGSRSPPRSHRSPAVPESHRSRKDHSEQMDQMSHRSHHNPGLSPPVPAVKHRRQQHNHLDDGDYENNYYNDAYNYNNYKSKPGQAKQRSQYTDLDPIQLPVNDNEFIPFTRTTEILDPSHADDPLTVSRENTKITKARRAYHENHQPADYGDKTGHEKDPIYNPNLVKDHPTSRQDQILLQLSTLKQNLIQKQRELETYMSPSTLEQS